MYVNIHVVFVSSSCWCWEWYKNTEHIVDWFKGKIVTLFIKRDMGANCRATVSYRMTDTNISTVYQYDQCVY